MQNVPENGQRDRRVLFVVQYPYPHDRLVRTRKMVATVTKNAWRAVVLSPWQPSLAKREQTPQVLIIRRGGYRLANRRPSPISVRWLIWIATTLKKEACSCCVVSDLRLALPAILASRSLGVPVVLDLGENFAAATKIWARRDPPLRRWLRSGPHVEWLERVATRLANRVHVVVEERRAQICRDFRVGLDHVVVVGNTPDEILPDEVVANSLARRRECGSGAPLRLLYSGIVTEDRGLDIVIESVRTINANGRLSVRLTVVGSGDYLEGLKHRAADLVRSELCDFPGWLSGPSLKKAILEADIGVIPHQLDDHWNSTVPNKLFDYMNCGLAVIASQTPPVERILHGAGAGVTFDGSSGGLVRAITALESREERERLGRNGRHAVQSQYNWTADGAAFLRSLADVLEPKRLDEAL